MPKMDANQDCQKPLLFIGQCLTETKTIQKRELIQQVLNVVRHSINTVCKQRNIAFDFGPGKEAEVFTAKYSGDFKARFTAETNIPFTPKAFADWRKACLDQAVGLIMIRTDMSESRHFEMGQFSSKPDWEQRTFMLIANLPEANLKTTLTKGTNLIHFDVITVFDSQTKTSSYRLAYPHQLAETLTAALLASPMVNELLSMPTPTRNRGYFFSCSEEKTREEPLLQSKL